MKIKLGSKKAKDLKEKTRCLNVGRAVTIAESGLRMAQYLLSPARAKRAKIKSIEMQDISAAVFTSHDWANRAANAFRLMEKPPKTPGISLAEAKAVVLARNAAELNQSIRKNPRVKPGEVPRLRKRVGALLKDVQSLWDVTRIVCGDTVGKIR